MTQFPQDFATDLACICLAEQAWPKHYQTASSTLLHREHSQMLLRLQWWSAAGQGIQAWQSVCWQQRCALSTEPLNLEEEKEESIGEQASPHPSPLECHDSKQHGMMQVLPACLPNMFALTKGGPCISKNVSSHSMTGCPLQVCSWSQCRVSLCFDDLL